MAMTMSLDSLLLDRQVHIDPDFRLVAVYSSGSSGRCQSLADYGSSRLSIMDCQDFLLAAHNGDSMTSRGDLAS